MLKDVLSECIVFDERCDQEKCRILKDILRRDFRLTSGDHHVKRMFATAGWNHPVPCRLQTVPVIRLIQVNPISHRAPADTSPAAHPVYHNSELRCC